MRDFSQVKGGCTKWPNGKYASVEITWKAVLYTVSYLKAPSTPIELF